MQKAKASTAIGLARALDRLDRLDRLATRLRTGWSSPGGTLRAMRLVIYVIGLATIATTVPLAIGATGIAPAADALGVASLLSLCGLAVTWSLDFRRGQAWLGWLPVECLALATITIGLGPTASVNIAFSAVMLRAVFGSGRRAAAWLLAYVSTYAIAVGLGRTDVVAGLLQVPILLLTGAVVYVFYRVVVAHDADKVALATQSDELRRRTRDLESLLGMSRELAQTPDSSLGYLIARHIAAAVGADEARIGLWDRAANELAGYGYFPAIDRTIAEPIQALEDHAATRRELMERHVAIVDLADPSGDQGDVRYLSSLGGLTMTFVPMVAAGQALGIVELLNRDGRRIEGRDLAIAQAMAHEAAIAIENSRLYEQIRHQAMHDPLTGLGNRLLFQDRLEHALARHRREGRASIALSFIDVDDFKRVNDQLGHDVGDRVLRAVADRLSRLARSGDTLARLAGDEFALLSEDVDGPDAAEAIAERILATFREPLAVDDREIKIGLSLGIDVGSGTTSTPSDLMRNADFAMYAAKTAGKGTFRRYQVADRTGLDDRESMTHALALAVGRDELRIEYQPIVALPTGKVVSFEALVRWQHPTRGLLPPAAFIRLAEETGAITELGRWVLRTACADLRDWQRQRPNLSVAINLSVRQLEDDQFVDAVREAISEYRIRPQTLVFEVTETYLLGDGEEVATRLHALKALGVRLAIDDFGTGYASLSYLRQFPVDILKIDREFTAGADTTDGAALLRGIVHLGKVVGVDVIAEGVERPDQLWTLIDADLEFAQGYLMARPMSTAAVVELIGAGNFTMPTSATSVLRPRSLRRARGAA